MSNISAELKNKAISIGLCQNWQDDWGSLNREQLVNMYLRGIHWCMERSYPSLSYLNENFGDILEDNNIYTYGERCITKEQKVVARGDTETIFYYSYRTCAFLYLGDNTTSYLYACDDSVITIHLYQGAKLNIEMCEPNAKVYVYQYGGSVEINDPSENIKIIDKR